MRIDFSYTDDEGTGGLRFHRVDDWPNEWGVPRIDEEVSLPNLVGVVTGLTYFNEPPDEEGEGYTVVVHVRT
jgi:hypothetical protein